MIVPIEWPIRATGPPAAAALRSLNSTTASVKRPSATGRSPRGDRPLPGRSGQITRRPRAACERPTPAKKYPPPPRPCRATRAGGRPAGAGCGGGGGGAGGGGFAGGPPPAVLVEVHPVAVVEREVFAHGTKA